MKIVAIVGSPHAAKGNTAKLTQIVLAGAEREGAQTETIYLPGNTVLPCLACDYCHKKGRCLQQDSFEAIQEKVKQADGLVLGSPNYIFSVSAQAKAFMDRCAGMIHCLGFHGKYGASVVTSGGGDEGPIAEYMNHFLMITGIQSVGSVWATMGSIFGDDFPEEITPPCPCSREAAGPGMARQRDLPSNPGADGCFQGAHATADDLAEGRVALRIRILEGALGTRMRETRAKSKNFQTTFDIVRYFI